MILVMTSRQRRGKQYFNRSGVSVLEVGLFIALSGLIICFVSMNAARQINDAKASCMLTEMMGILEAGWLYHESTGSWPEELEVLSPLILSAIPVSPFGGRYSLSHSKQLLIVHVKVPNNLRIPSGNWAMLVEEENTDGKQWRMSKVMPINTTSRLMYAR